MVSLVLPSGSVVIKKTQSLIVIFGIVPETLAYEASLGPSWNVDFSTKSFGEIMSGVGDVLGDGNCWREEG